MTEKEYYTVNEISKYYKSTSRNVRRIIYTLREESSENLLRKGSIQKYRKKCWNPFFSKKR